jgi:hypothetical protein
VRRRRLAHRLGAQRGLGRALTPLEELARLLAKHGHAAHAKNMASLSAREEARVEGAKFWGELAAPDVWGDEDSVASVTLGGVDAPESDELARDRGVFRRSLFAVAEELRLRGFESDASERWRKRLKGC